MGICQSDSQQKINEMALQQIQTIVLQKSQKNIQLLITGPQQSGRKTFLHIFQPDEYQNQFLGGKSFETIKQRQISIQTYEIDRPIQTFNMFNCVIFTIASNQLEQYNDILKQSLLIALQQKTVQKVLLLITHTDKQYILTKNIVMRDIQQINQDNKLLILESNLLIMEKMTDAIEWIFNDLSSI